MAHFHKLMGLWRAGKHCPKVPKHDERTMKSEVERLLNDKELMNNIKTTIAVISEAWSRVEKDQDAILLSDSSWKKCSVTEAYTILHVIPMMIPKELGAEINGRSKPEGDDLTKSKKRDRDEDGYEDQGQAKRLKFDESSKKRDRDEDGYEDQGQAKRLKFDESSKKRDRDEDGYEDQGQAKRLKFDESSKKRVRDEDGYEDERQVKRPFSGLSGLTLRPKFKEDEQAKVQKRNNLYEEILGGDKSNQCEEQTKKDYKRKREDDDNDAISEELKRNTKKRLIREGIYSTILDNEEFLLFDSDSTV
ncbi:hypothetical protein V8F33_001723 [Rhypophila sp. PSN 637]